MLSSAILVVNASVNVLSLVDLSLLFSGGSLFLTSVSILLCCFPSARSLVRDRPFDSSVNSESSFFLIFSSFVLVSAVFNADVFRLGDGAFVDLSSLVTRLATTSVFPMFRAF